MRVCKATINHNSAINPLPLSAAPHVREFDAQSGKLCNFASLRGAYRNAKSLTDQHGEGAAIQAAMKADAMLDEGDLDGAAVWRRIVAAINDLQREEPKPGERRH